MVVYADIIFAVNFISAYIMLYLLGRYAIKEKISVRRLVLASVIGGIGAVIAFSFEMREIITYALRLLTMVLMSLTAFYNRRRQLIEQMIWIFAMSAIMMFSVFILSALVQKAVSVIVKAGVIYLDIPPMLFIIVFTVSYAALALFMKVFKSRKNKRYYIMSITHNGKTIDVTALFDSGNLLKEPITGKYVSIVEWDRIKWLFDADYTFDDIGMHAEDLKLWAVPFKSLGNKSGIIFAFIADRVRIPQEKKIIDKTFIGIYGSELSKNKEYHALINAGLI